MTKKKEKPINEPRVGLLRDMLQAKKKIDVPEIRVWCHPHRVGKNGSDYYEIFETFDAALKFIADRKEEAEAIPLVAFAGYEVNLWTLKK